MSVNISTNDIIQLRLNFFLGADAAYNILHYQINAINEQGTNLPVAVAAPAEAVLPEMASNLGQYMLGFWKEIASSDVEMQSVTVQDVYPSPRSIPFTFTFNGGNIGLRSANALPLQDSPTIVKRTRFGQKWGIGRVFAVGIAEEDQDDGFLGAAVIDSLNTWAGAIASGHVVPVNGVNYGLIPVLYHAATPAKDDKPATPTRITPIVAAELSDPRLKTQRRRRPGKGI